MDARSGFEIDGQARHAAADFRPALRLWGEVLSRPNRASRFADSACATSYDQDLPVPLAAFRDGAPCPAGIRKVASPG